jgi:hypothetical protein
MEPFFFISHILPRFQYTPGLPDWVVLLKIGLFFKKIFIDNLFCDIHNEKMKKNRIYTIFFYLCILIPAGCISSPQKDGLKNLQIVTREKMILLYPDSSLSPQLEMHIDFLETSDENKLNKILQAQFYEDLDSQSYVNKVFNELENEYGELRLGENEFPQNDRPPASFNWDYDETVSASLINGRESAGEKSGVVTEGEFLVVSRNKEYFLGGAHGNREKQYLVIDTGSWKVLSLSSLIRDTAFPDVQRLVIAKLALRSELEPGLPLSEGGYFTDAPELTENFFLTDKGLGFYWNQYEIAPYSFGPITVIIPWKELTGFIKP